MNLSVLPEPFMSGSSGSDTNAEKEGGKYIRSWESSSLLELGPPRSRQWLGGASLWRPRRHHRPLVIVEKRRSFPARPLGGGVFSEAQTLRQFSFHLKTSLESLFMAGFGGSLASLRRFKFKKFPFPGCFPSCNTLKLAQRPFDLFFYP